MSTHDVLVRENDVDVVGLFAALIRKWWLILLMTLISGVGLFLGLSTLSPRYQSTAEVLISSRTSSAVEQIQEGGNRQVDNRLDERAVTTEVEVLSSDKIALSVIDQLQLYRIAEFRESDDNWEETIEQKVSEVTGELTPASDPLKDNPSISANDIARSAALRIFKKKLEVFAVEKSQVIKIEFWSFDPALARSVVSAITERYQSAKVDATKANVAQAAGFVNPRIEELKKLIDQERRAVVEFESQNRIFRTNNGSNDNPGLLVNQELSESSTELSRLRAERSAAQAKIASIRAALSSGASLDVIPEVLASQYIQNLRQSEVAIQAQISDLSTRLLPQHPQMKALVSQQQRYQNQIRKATEDIIASLESNVASLRNAEAQLEDEIDQLKEDQIQVNSFLVKLDGRKKNIAAYEEELQRRLTDSQQVRSRAEILPSAATVISPASIPSKPYFPKIVPFTLAGMTAVSVLTMVGILMVNLITTVGTYNAAAQPIRAEDHVEPELSDAEVEVPSSPVESEQPKKKTGLEELTSVMFGKIRKSGQSEPAIHQIEDKPNAVETEVKPTAKDESIIAVRYAASVLSDMGNGRITVVSPGGEAGSLTACILARLLSQSKRKVVLIDLSGGLATTQEMLGTIDVPGIFNLVTGSVSTEHVIFKDKASKVNIISAGEMFTGAPAIDVEMVGATIDAIADSFDFCIVDCGDANMDGINLVSTDDAVVVISAIEADESDCDRLERDLKADGFNDILQIYPDQKDLENEALAAA